MSEAPLFDPVPFVAKDLGIGPRQIAAVAQLFAEAAPSPSLPATVKRPTETSTKSRF